MESRCFGRGQFGTVLGLRENVDAVGCKHLQETFHKLEGLETEGCNISTFWNSGGWRCPSLNVQNGIRDKCIFFESGDRWVAILNVYFETSVDQRSPVNDQSSLGRFQRPNAWNWAINSGFSDHKVILGIDVITKVSFEHGWHVGPCAKPAKLTSKEQERASSFTFFL